MVKYTGPTYTTCSRCPKEPGQVVKFHEDDHEEALCFTCWKPLSDQHLVKVLHWINKYGRLMFAPGATTKPRN